MALLMAFLLQFIENQVVYHKITALDQGVNNFKEIIKQEGCILPEREILIRGEISKILNCNPELIQVTGTREPVERSQIIEYGIEVPVKDVVANKGFWGIPKDYDTIKYKVNRYTTSEYIGK